MDWEGCGEIWLESLEVTPWGFECLAEVILQAGNGKLETDFCCVCVCMCVRVCREIIALEMIPRQDDWQKGVSQGKELTLVPERLIDHSGVAHQTIGKSGQRYWLSPLLRGQR